MLKNIKGLVVALLLVVAIAGSFFFLKSGSVSPTPAGTETSSELASTSQETSIPAESTAITAPAETSAETQPAPTSPSAETSAPAEASAAAPSSAGLDLQAALAERSLGNADAPVTVIEYASLTCPHCAFFATNNLAAIKEKLINTGKLRLIYRDFPLDQHAMNAAKLARCAPQDKYFDFIEVIFKNQENWAKSDDPTKALMQLGALTGMSEDLMTACISSKELEDGLLSVVADAQDKFSLKATPTFVFNYGVESLSGAQDVTKFEEIVGRLTAGK